MTSATYPTERTTIDRPDWLTEDVWPFPIAGLEIDGNRMAYSDTGGDGPVIMFCHVGLWSLLWRDLMVEMSTQYRCVTFDTPGVGLSSRVSRSQQTLDVSVQAVGTLIDTLDLRELTLVVHDLGGLAGLAATNGRTDRISAVVAVNSFAWRPRGVLLPLSLRLFGSAPIRELSALTGWLTRASSTRFGVGRHMPKAGRRAWRRGLADRSARRVTHRLFADAARNRTVQRDAEAALSALADRPVMTVFGQFGDYLRFQRQWRRRRPDLTGTVVRRGLHFPMCDDPKTVAVDILTWLSDT